MVIHEFCIIENMQKFISSAYFASGNPVSHITPYTIREYVHAVSHTCIKSVHPVTLDNHTHVCMTLMTGNDLRNKILHQ
jgi:hypothetical protein